MFAICYACDNNYVPQVSVSIKSLLINNSSIETEIFIFADNISYKNKELLSKLAEGYSTVITFIDTSSIIKEIKETGLISNVDNASLSTFVRLFIQDYIPSKYDKVLYIDADTMIVGSISELIAIESNRPVSAVIDIMPRYYKNIIGLNDCYYFNCGILLINMCLWREKACEQRILRHISNRYNKYLYADQDVINIVLNDEIDILPLKYNFFPFYGEIEYKNLISYIGSSDYYTEAEFLSAQTEPVIIHLVYSVFDRPWFEGNLNKYSNQWDEFIAQTDWKQYKKKKRKIFSRTKLLQFIYQVFGEKKVINIQSRRNVKIFNKAKLQYERDGMFK